MPPTILHISLVFLLTGSSFVFNAVFSLSTGRQVVRKRGGVHFLVTKDDAEFRIRHCFSGAWPIASERSVFVLNAKSKKRVDSDDRGTGGGGFGAVKEQKKKLYAKERKQILKRVEETFGGMSSDQIASSTQELIQKQIRQLPPNIELAVRLYQKLQLWENHVSALSVLQQAQLDPTELEGAKRARMELDRLYETTQCNEEDSVKISCDQDIHTLLQRFTWDASADAKAARSLIGDMTASTKQRIERACRIAASSQEGGLVLDVGCGFGVLVPFLRQAGWSAANIHGVDLSPQMIRNAQELYGGGSQGSCPTFIACDFLNDYSVDFNKFSAVIFCCSLHDLPNQAAALTKATSLLKLGGKIVIVHPQGASHVMQQVRSNPILVKRGLPSSDELRQLPNLKLIVEPAPAGSLQDNEEGYLAVLEKVN